MLKTNNLTGLDRPGAIARPHDEKSGVCVGRRFRLLMQFILEKQLNSSWKGSPIHYALLMKTHSSPDELSRISGRVVWGNSDSQPSKRFLAATNQYRDFQWQAKPPPPSDVAKNVEILFAANLRPRTIA